MLKVSKLKARLLDLSKVFPSSGAEAGKRVAQAYQAYAAEAVTIPGSSPITLGPSTALLANLLGICFATSTDLNVTSDQLSQAFTAFWLPVVFSAVPPSGPGAVTLVAGTAALATGLKALGPVSDADAAAQRLAVLIDAFTHLVTVTHPNPGGAVVMTLV